MKSKKPKYRAEYWKKYRLEYFPYAVKTCLICGKDYNPERGGSKTCPKCRKGKCVQCGKEFDRNRIAAKFCSRKCHNESLKGKEPITHGRRGKRPRTYFKAHRDKHGCAEDREWRSKVFERDNFTCQNCGQHGGKLQADHIKSVAAYPELRHEVSNGRTLCVPCHQKTPNYGYKAVKEIAARRMAQEVLL